MKLFKLLVIFHFSFNTFVYAQFPGAAGTIGSTAIHKDSSIFVSWANTCRVKRGLQQINDTSLGYVNTGDSAMAIGHADGIQVVSLGDGGSAILGFINPIKNGPGFDFAVFENGFIDEFLELAFVEVSSDGINFFRFKAISNTQTDVQMGPFDYTANPTMINNLAGKYRAMYGTPFDLEEMVGLQGLNVDSITYVKVIDVVGSIDSLYGSLDQNNNLINDHFPTPFPQGGFDLDAVGVLHQQINGLKNYNTQMLQTYPNPFTSEITLIENVNQIKAIEIMNIDGKIIYQSNELKSKKIDLSYFENGVYLVRINMKDESIKLEKLIKVVQ
jgi:hypothetical protein